MLGQHSSQFGAEPNSLLVRFRSLVSHFRTERIGLGDGATDWVEVIFQTQNVVWQCLRVSVCVCIQLGRPQIRQIKFENNRDMWQAKKIGEEFKRVDITSYYVLPSFHLHPQSASSLNQYRSSILMVQFRVCYVISLIGGGEESGNGKGEAQGGPTNHRHWPIEFHHARHTFYTILSFFVLYNNSSLFSTFSKPVNFSSSLSINNITPTTTTNYHHHHLRFLLAA